MSNRNVSLIVKVSRRCNLRCTYCNEWEDTKTKMPFKVMMHLIGKTMADERFQNLSFILHGGEPLMCGREYFDRILYLQSKFARPGQRILNCLQTNGTLLTDSWIDYFTTNNLFLGMSIDGPPEVHNRQRPTIPNRASHESVLRAIRRLQEHDVNFAVLCVVTRDTLRYGARRLFDYFANLDLKSFALLPLRPKQLPSAVYDPNADYLSREEFAAFDKEFFDAWWDYDSPDVQIREYTSLLGRLIGGQASVCTLAGDCIGYNFAVNPNGDIFHCDHFVDDPDYLLGNIVTDTWDDVYANEKVEVLKRRDQTRHGRLENCPYYEFCSGGCPSDYYIDRRTLGFKETGCCGKGYLIEHMLKRLEESGVARGTRLAMGDVVTVPVALSPARHGRHARQGDGGVAVRVQMARVSE